MDPLTIMTMIAVGKIGQKLFGGTSSGSSSPASTTTCRWCGNAISGGAKATACCHSPLCQTCTPEWQRAGGKNCVLCGTRQA